MLHRAAVVYVTGMATIRAALALVLLLAPAASLAAAPTLDDVIRGLEHAYGRMTDLTAQFSQTAFNKSLNTTIPAQGAVYLKRGGKLRWEYSEPTNKRSSPTARRSGCTRRAQPGQHGAGSGSPGRPGRIVPGRARSPARAFHVRLLNPAQPTDAEGNVVLDLTPKQPVPTLARLILSLEPRHWEIRKAVVHDQFENTVTMQFSRVTLNSGLADRLFTFVAPPGTATVPLR